MDKEGHETKRSALGDYACKVCAVRYVTLQDCLKHELLAHSFSKNGIGKSKQKHVKSILESLQNPDRYLQARVQAEVDACQSGEELKTILKLYCIDTENLEQSYRHIHTCLKKEIQNVGRFNIYPFGSVANGLALKSSDIDIYIDNNDCWDDVNKQFRITFNRVSSLLLRSDCFVDVVPIRQARVPIIKCKHLPSGYNIDINMSCPSSVNNTNFLRDIICRDERLHQMFLFLKIWSKHLHITGRGGNMNSYCLVTLIIFYLQNTPNWSDRKMPAILPSMEELQKHTAANIVQGVNYAYNLKEVPALAKHHTARSLIKGFFLFYDKFNFMDNIVSTFLAQTIARSQFTADKEKFKIYTDQLRALSILQGAPARPLQMQQCMCVQDIFCLNLNVARSVTPSSFEYILKCLACAAKICTTNVEPEYSNGEFYKLLLYGVSEQLLKPPDPLPTPTPPDAAKSLSSSSLSFSITPSRVDLRALISHVKELENDKLSMHKLWVQHYVELIPKILTDIYKLDVQKTHPTHCFKNKKLEDSELIYMWTLNSSVDMWTGRTFEGKNSMLFMEHQKQLSERFQQQRRQNSGYAIQLNALLTLNILNDYSIIELKIQQIDSSSVDVSKKSPLRKFFGNLKVGITSFNFKEKLLGSDMTATKKLLAALTKESGKIVKQEQEGEKISGQDQT